MELSGSGCLHKIAMQINSVQSQYSQLESRIQSSESEVIRLNKEREQAFVDLSRLYLPELESEAISNTINQLRGKIETIYEKKLVQQEGLSKKAFTLQEKIDAAERELQKVDRLIDEKDSQLEELKKSFDSQLERSPDYQILKSKAEEAKKILAAEKDRASIIERLARETLQPYQENKVFAYLHSREGEEFSRITEFFDSLAAKSINFREANARYQILTELPKAVGKKVSASAEEYKQAKEKISQYEAKISEEVGLTKAIAEARELDNDKKKYLIIYDKLEDDCKFISKELKEASSSQGKHYKEALSYLQTYLSGENITELWKRARATETKNDDELVSKIEEANNRIANLNNDIRTLSSQANQLNEKLSGLRNIKRHCTHHDYESGRSYFSSGFNVDTFLTGFIASQFSERDVTEKIDSNQHFKPVESYHYSSDSSSSSSSWSSDSGFGGGGFGSDGGFGGGGFSSDGGF